MPEKGRGSAHQAHQQSSGQAPANDQPNQRPEDVRRVSAVRDQMLLLEPEPGVENLV